MQAVYAFMRGITRLNDWLGRAVALLVLVMFGLLLAEVFFRYAWGAPVVWTGELGQLLFGVYGVLAGGYVMAHHGHVNVDLVYSRFSPRTKAAVDVCTSFMFFIFVGALVYFGTSFALESISYWERSMSAWNPPIWPVKLAIPIGAFLLLLQGLVKLIRDILVLCGIDVPMDEVANQGPGDSL